MESLSVAIVGEFLLSAVSNLLTLFKSSVFLVICFFVCLLVLSVYSRAEKGVLKSLKYNFIYFSFAMYIFRLGYCMTEKFDCVKLISW